MIDIDTVNQKLYWGSSSNAVIGVSDLDGKNSNIIYDNAINVHDLRVDPSQG